MGLYYGYSEHHGLDHHFGNCLFFIRDSKNKKDMPPDAAFDVALDVPQLQNNAKRLLRTSNLAAARTVRLSMHPRERTTPPWPLSLEVQMVMSQIFDFERRFPNVYRLHVDLRGTVAIASATAPTRGTALLLERRRRRLPL